MRLGIDIHGVLDHHPEKYIKLAIETKWLNHYDGEKKNSVHILTGPTRKTAEKELQKLADEYSLGIPFWDEIHSIVDYVIENDIPHYYNDKGRLWTKELSDWDRIKGTIAKKLELDLHFDDSPEYEKYFHPGVFCLVKRRKPYGKNDTVVWN